MVQAPGSLVWPGLLGTGLLVACSHAPEGSSAAELHDGVNRALRFDGVDDYATLPTAGFPVALEAASIEVWFKPDRLVDSQTLAKVGRGSLSGVKLGLFDANPTAWRVWGPVEFAASSVPVSQAEWHYLAYTYDPGTHCLYVDGQLVATGSEYTNNRSPSLVWLGATDGTDDFFAGEIDEFRVWARALSEAELSPTPAPVGDDADLVMQLTFDEVSGARLVDASRQGNDGLLGDGIEAFMPERVLSDR